MKKFLISLVVVLVLNTQAFGAENLGAEKQNVISMDLLDFTREVASVQYERVFDPQWTFHVSPRILIGDVNGLGIIGGIRRYIDLAPKGVFLDMVGGLASVSSGWATGRGYLFGGGMGYKFFPSEDFAIEGCLGISYLSATASIGWFSATVSGMAVTGSLSLGYAF